MLQKTTDCYNFSFTRSVPRPPQVLVEGQQLVRVGRIRDLHLDHPGAFVRVAVDHAGVFIDRVIHGDDFAGDAAVEVTRGLDGFDLAEGLAGRDLGADLGERDVGDVGQLVGGDLGDADRGGVAVELVPFVGFEVLAVGGGRHLGSPQC